MALNVKAALSICGLFITGLCYLVDQVALPVEKVAGPMHVYRAGPPDAPGAKGASAVAAPTGVLPRFARGNAFELQNAAGRVAAQPVAVVAVPPPPATARLVALPPVARPELSEVSEAATPMTLMAVTQENAVPSLPATGTGREAAAAPPAVLAAGQANPTAGQQPAGQPTATRYTVRKGDSLSKIARRLWNADDRQQVQLLMEANPKLRKRPNRIFVGEELVIPARAVAQAAPAAEDKPTVAAADAPAVVQASARDVRKTPPPRWYTIRAGDSLASIARRHLSDVGRWREIVALNRLRNPNKIVPGMRIRLPGLGRSQG